MGLGHLRVTASLTASRCAAIVAARFPDSAHPEKNVAKRHRMQVGDWESIIGRLQELVLANSGEDAFEEIFKLLIAKLADEFGPTGPGAFRAHRSAADVVDAINGLLRRAARQWPGVLGDEVQSRLTPEHLAVCVQALQDCSLCESHLEVLDGMFEYLVNHASKGSKGQFFTPRHVVDACVRIVSPSANELVLDPACGSGGFLVHALQYVREQTPTVDMSSYAARQLWGFDFDVRAARVAKALMVIAGDGETNIFRVNSLLTPAASSDLFDLPETSPDLPWLTIEDVMRGRVRNFRGFDVILTNPPFAGELQEQHMLSAYELGRTNRRVERDVIFLERCIQLLRPGGRIAIVLPHNKVGARSWDYVREWLVRHVRVVAVLGMGRNTFLPHTHQKTSVIFATKRHRPVVRPPHERILFAVSEREGKDTKGQVLVRAGSSTGGALWDRADHDFADVVKRFSAFVKDEAIEWGGN